MVKGFPVYRHAFFLRHFRRQVNGEPKGIIQLKGVRARKDRLAPFLVGRKQVVVNTHSAVDGLGEILLLHPNDLGDIILILPQVRVSAFVLMHHGVHHFMQERPVHAQQPSMTCGPAEQTAEDIAPALVGGKHAVADHHHGRPDVVRNHTQAHVRLVALSIMGVGDFADLVGDVHDGVHIKEGTHVLTHAGQTLQTHAGVNILVQHFLIVALAVVDKLRENVVPDLDITVAVTADGAAGFAAAVFLAPVVVDL